MKGKYDCILCDPPFLSPDCQTKGDPRDNSAYGSLLTPSVAAAMTVRWLSKPALPDAETPGPKIIVCTGERMEVGVFRVLFV